MFYTGEDQQVYSVVGFDYQLWQRYLATFESVLVAGRLELDVSRKPANAQLLSSGENVTFAAIPNLSNPATRMTNMRQARRLMESALKSADAVIARLPSEVGLLAIQVAKSMGLPWAVEVVGDAWGAYWNYGTVAGKLIAPVTYWRHRRWIRKSEFAIYVTKHFLQWRYPCAGLTEYASNVQIQALPDEVIEQRIDRIRTSAGRGLRIGLIGYLTSYKGIDTAIKALRSIIERFPNCELHIVGKGEPEKWQRLAASMGIADRVRFVGTMPSAQLMDWLRTLDLYLQPSRTEGLPRALIEAMSTGCPCIASTAGGIPELLEPEALHRPGDYRTLSKLMANALSDPEWRIRQARVVFRRASEYDSSSIELRRAEFWRIFRNRIGRSEETR